MDEYRDSGDNHTICSVDFDTAAYEHTVDDNVVNNAACVMTITVVMIMTIILTDGGTLRHCLGRCWTE